MEKSINPRININMVRKVKQLRKKVLIHGKKVPMPFRHTKTALGVKSVKQVYLWYQYGLK